MDEALVERVAQEQYEYPAANRAFVTWPYVSDVIRSKHMDCARAVLKVIEGDNQ